MTEQWYEENKPSEEDIKFLLRKMNRKYGLRTSVVTLLGYLNFKHLGPAIVVCLTDKYRDCPQFRFITKGRQKVWISMTDAKYIKSGNKIHRLHDEDMRLFDDYMKLIFSWEDESNWKFATHIYNGKFPRYRIKCEQPDYSKLNSTR